MIGSKSPKTRGFDAGKPPLRPKSRPAAMFRQGP